MYRDNAIEGVDQAGIRAIVASFERSLGAVALRSSARARQEIDALAQLEAPALWELHRRLTCESRRIQAECLLRHEGLPETCPKPDREAAGLAFRGGLSLADTLKCYRIGHACTMEAWLEAIDQSELAPNERARCLTAITPFVTEYDNRIADLVGKEYERLQRLGPDLGPSRLELIRALINGDAETASELGYQMDLHHIGIVASGIGAETAVAEMASSLGQQHLAVAAEDGLIVGWLGSERNGLTAKRLLGEFDPPAGVSLGIGNVHSGYEGLRRTHREAGEAHRVLIRHPQAITFYDDVVLEIMALRDEVAAWDFVADVLTGLNDEGQKSRRLRATLAAYFQSEQNAVAAAASLGIHAVTVSRHLDEIEARIGRQVNQRRAELESALRLRSLLGPDPQQPATARTLS